MPDRMNAPPEAEVRFQYDVIKGLAESVRQMAQNMAELQKTQIDMLVRLARLEENKVGEELITMKAATAALAIRVDALESAEDQRKGAYSVFSWLRIWGPVIFSCVAAAWLLGRSLGIVPAPPAPAPTHIEHRRTQ